MLRLILAARLTLSLLFVDCLAQPVMAQAVSVLMQHNDLNRTGSNLSETTLNTSNVNVNQFGKIFTRGVDGQIYAQPLVVAGVTIAGKTQNVVYVVTMHNSVYAFDADNASVSAALWHVNLGASVASSCPDTQPEYGIMATPAIDTATNTMYIVARTTESNGSIAFRLHALDITSGAEKPNSPVLIQASVPGIGLGAVNGTITFDPSIQLNRPGLALSGGNVYLGFGSICDGGNYHGWVMSYNATTLAQTAVYNSTPHGGFGGFWAAGAAPAIDSGGNIYYVSGNGSFDANQPGGFDYGDTFLKLSPSLAIEDWFTPYNEATLQQQNLDLGSTGPWLLPGTTYVVGGGKQGLIYVVNTTNMGHFNSTSNSQIVQSFQATAGEILAAPVFWSGPAGQFMYVWSENDALKQFQFSAGLFQTTATAVSAAAVPDGEGGGALSISANGSSAGTGIVWATGAVNASTSPPPGILRAYDATNVGKELWDSYQNQSRDDFGSFAKFAPPTIANGKVYVATFSNQLVVYGLLSSSSGAPVVTAESPANGATGAAITTTVTATFSTAMTASTITASTFTLTPSGGSAVAATVSYNSTTNVATLTPSAALANSTTYTATVVGGANGVKSSAGTAMTGNVTWTFTTAAAGGGGGAIPTAGLAVWFKADAGITLNGSTVSQWADQSGNGNHATQPTASAQPTLASGAINGLPAVSFNGTQDMQFPLPVDGLSGMTIFLVNANGASFTGGGAHVYNSPIFWNATADWGTVYLSPFEQSVAWGFGTGQANNDPIYTRPASIGTAFTLTDVVKNGATENLYVAGTLVATATGKLAAIADTQPTGNLGVGYLNTHWNGQIAEVIVYTVALTDAQRQQVEQYLTTKYFTAGSSAPMVVTESPSAGATSVLTSTTVTAAFSTAMTASTITTSTFTLTPSGGSAVAATVSYNSTTNVATLTPSAVLASGTTYTAMVVGGSGGVKSSSGAAMAANFAWTFTTAAAGSTSIPTAGLAVWFKADAGITLNGSTVSQWADQSGNARNATQPTVAAQPELVSGAINGLPAVNFNGSDRMQFPLAVNGLTAMTIFLVNANGVSYTGGGAHLYNSPLFWDATANWGAVYLSPFEQSVVWAFGTGQVNNAPIYTRPASIGTAFTMTDVVKNGTTENLYVGGTLVSTQTGKLAAIANTQPTGNLGVGFLDTRWNGQIAEVIVYTVALTDAQRQQVEQYLKTRYGL